ncbi:putative salt-induced outer membrane protein [Mariprofundus ferrinatatus]|uniref:Putative salt-induced outer membrane protein n=1 Tax=Mariprofundus ferrinatatus TaxID=1921087 RepID=A0A2K8L199_9PROT|nr:DUF481 domain-containing protein [Mariprofundus ferrinatatus]ATX81057.1 putative salt-induced outer membrane protein [Mariprofundus ferrinatatus]
MMKKTVIPFLSIMMISPIAAIAEEEASAWKNNVELGAVQTSGNTQTLTVNAKAKSVHDGEIVRSTLTGSANNSTDRNRTTAETYKASLQEDWKFSERGYVFGRLGFESDRFAGFRSRFSETVGYGRDLVKTDALLWKFELGGGLRQTRFTDRTKKSEAIIRSATGLNWKVSDSALFTQEISTEGGKSGWATESITGLQHALNSHLSSKIAVKLEHNSKVPAGIKKLDVETAITLVVNF